MKSEQNPSLFSTLNSIKREIDLFARPEGKGNLLKNLDDLISALGRLRTELTNPSLEAKASEIGGPLEKVIQFLEQAKSDESLQTLLRLGRINGVTAAKREPVDIPGNLTNEQIRSLLERDLSKTELRAVARQRGISVGKFNNQEIIRLIVKNLERQEGYERLSVVRQ